MEMRRIKNSCIGIMLIAAGMFSPLGFAVVQADNGDVGTGNPYLPLWEHMPDGEPRVFEDPDNPGRYRAYVIGSHDVRYKHYCGGDVHMWSAPVENLTDWRDEGAVFSYNVGGRWDVMFAPDLVEVKAKDGTKDYYLYPHSCGYRRMGMVCKGKRPDGPFTPVNMTADGTRATDESLLGFDPSVYVEEITNPADPDYGTGYRAYGYWGFQHSSAVQLDPNTMYSKRPGTDVISYFLPSCSPDGNVLDPQGTTYPALCEGENPIDFGFYEASSIRKIGNKYLMIYSGFSGKEYGLDNSNSTLRYAFGDTPLGPWRNGGVLVDSRGIVPSEDGTRLQASNFGHNTHGSLQEINGQWYVFYHRPPRGFGFARQAMVAPVTIQWEEKSVADGGRVVIRAYDPYNKKGVWTAKSSDGCEYTGAEVTSEGFQLYGLPPYKYYSAGYACYLSNNSAMQDSWDVWDNNMPVIMNGTDIVGFKYFGFGGLDVACKGLLPFEGTKKGNGTQFNVFLQPAGGKGFKLNVWLDGPWDNKIWRGKKLGEIDIPDNAPQETTKYTLDVSSLVDGIGKKHAVYITAEGDADRQLCRLIGVGFSKKGEEIGCQAPPTVTIRMDGRILDIPSTPVRMTEENGYTGYGEYEIIAPLQSSGRDIPIITASSDNPDVGIDILQPRSRQDKAVVKCTYKGMVKNFTIRIK